VLEEYEHAKARGAKIYAEVTGYGLSGDAYHITAPTPDGNGGYRAMQSALKHAGLQPPTSTTSTRTAPRRRWATSWSWARSSGCWAMRRARPAMSSTKSAIGHLLGAGGRGGGGLHLPGHPRPGRAADHQPRRSVGGDAIDLVPHKAKPMPIRAALSNSFGFGGTNASWSSRRSSERRGREQGRDVHAGARSPAAAAPVSGALAGRTLRGRPGRGTAR
jgi:3-oxoacyl-[acyl-carrier-protein] synthase II